ncbi:hypothetical protein [Arthrobacter cryoconiti]|uniref:AraC family transcriptional regulator n=1 Tax=Arthrobacter cryoconiti TaxID=748907 RepID=A0ABV8QW81_9MICC|nr:hypothetical protein [Arthrobacter cryoconiti]MCC9068704.1 hypothetical protein [Arthrobacter cryoconiti]
MAAQSLQDQVDLARNAGADSCHVVMSPGWSILVQDRAPFTVMAMMSGTAFLEADSGRFVLEKA